MKIYYQYSSVKKLQPTGGDFITEIGVITALSQFADVYYSGTLFNPKVRGYGLSSYPEPIASRVTREYDAYVIRSSIAAFQAAPGDKVRLWNAAPFDLDCYRKATAIFCFSRAWEKDLRGANKYTRVPARYQRTFKNTVTIHQVVSDRFFPRQASVRTRSLRKEIGGDFIVGYFGCARKSRYPHGFLRAWTKFSASHPSSRFLLSVIPGRKSLPFPASLPNVTRRAFSYSEMPYALSACDLLVIGRQQISGEISGCSKTLEAAACGVPIMLGHHAARVEALGEDYPFYVPPIGGWNSGEVGIQGDADAALAMLETIAGNAKLRGEVADSLPAKVKRFSVKASGRRLERLFRKLVKKGKL